MINDDRPSNVVVTGASSGIGRALVTEFIDRGARVYAVARNTKKLEELANMYPSGRVSVISADLAGNSGIERLLNHIIPEEVDVLVNNAGVGYYGDFDSADQHTYRQLLRLNLEALTELSRYFSGIMKKRKSGGILNIASMASLSPVPGFAVYAASKSYVRNLSIALHHELKAYGVHVTCCNPGPVNTGFFKASGSGIQDHQTQNLITPDIVAQKAVKGLFANKKQVFPGYREKLLYVLNSVIPECVSLRIAARSVRKHQKL